MAPRNEDHSHIKGWGSDLSHDNRPAYPKERMPPRLQGVHWTQPEQQSTSVTVFHSLEREGLTPVFGSSVPPSGLSGLIRKGAFQFGENDVRHWALLLFADRVNVLEGLLDDARKSPRVRVLVGAAAVVSVLGAIFSFARRR